MMNEHGAYMELQDIYSEFQWEQLEIQLKALYPQWDISIWNLIQEICKGNGIEAITELFGQAKNMLFMEWESLKMIFMTILVVVLLSAVFVTFKDAFQNHQIADISFYLNYLILIILFVGLFQNALEIGENTLQNLEEFMRLFFPTYFMTVGAVSGVTTGMVYYQIAGLVIYVVELILKAVLLPCISAYMLFVIMNGIWGEEKLELLLELWKKGIKAVLKIILGLLTGASLIQSLITPVIDRVKGETIYKAVEAIPGIGELAEGAARVWLGSAVLIKNSIGIVSCILLLAVCFVPLMKIAVTGCLLKAAAAILGLVGEKRMIHCMNCVGDGILLLLQTITYGILFFLVLVAITAYTTNGGF